MSPEKLLAKTEAEKLTHEEFDHVVDKLIAASSDIDASSPEELFYYLRILRLKGNPELKDIVAKFLYYPKKPLVSRVALLILCQEWGLTKQYLSVLKNFIKGEGWDLEDLVRDAAMIIAGDYLRFHHEGELLQLLLNLFDHLGETKEIVEHKKSERMLLKRSAYYSISSAMGMNQDKMAADWKQFVKAFQSGHLDEFVDSHMLQKAQKRVKENNDNVP